MRCTLVVGVVLPGAAARAEEPARGAGAAAKALAVGAPDRALRLADEAVAQEPKDPWAHYNRAAALANLQRVDDAVAAYRSAEARFGDDVRGRALAVWGRAHVLYRSSRCDEARTAFQEYVDLAGATDPEGAAVAASRMRSCR